MVMCILIGELQEEGSRGGHIAKDLKDVLIKCVYLSGDVIDKR